MESLDRLAQPWWQWIVAASWQLALLACLVGGVVVLARQASPRVRHALWLLVVLKVFLPPGMTAPWSVGQFAAPWLETHGVFSHDPLRDASFSGAASDTPEAAAARGTSAGHDQNGISAGGSPTLMARSLSPVMWLMLIWGVGFLAFWGLVAWRYRGVLRLMRGAPVIDEGPVRVMLEQIGLSFGAARTPELLATSEVTSPFLFGTLRPRIVLPEGLLGRLDEIELRAVLTHEFVHWQRRDVWIGWLQVAAQSLLWFHPLLWWANREVRHERECVCDEAVLQLGQIAPPAYGDSIVRVLLSTGGRSMVTGSLVGVFERGAKLQNRLEEIVNYKPHKQRFGWWSRWAVLAFAVAVLPMASGAIRQQAVADDASAQKQVTPAAVPTRYPQIVTSVPAIGATDVDPALQEIRVTFDRDMSKGMSWTGGPPEFPNIPKDAKARWIDHRTCVLPVILAKGSLYRVGINSTSFQNFRASDGVPVPTAAIFFTTQGARAEVVARVQLPQIVTLSPANGAMNVDPKTTQLRVKFNVSMGAGMSWTGSGPTMPKVDETIPAIWSEDGKTCTLTVKLEPGRSYEIGLNSLDHKNFQTRYGVPLAPVVYRFQTAGK